MEPETRMVVSFVTVNMRSPLLDDYYSLTHVAIIVPNHRCDSVIFIFNFE
jgi:hypothetical protein